MTKYEWERELKKNIKSLPSDEIDKILDFYSELFEDKAESGLREADIITEFGNPFDVARRIVNDYEYANGKGERKSRDDDDDGNEDDVDDDRPEFVKKMTVGLRKSFTKFTDSVKRGFVKNKPEPEETDDYYDERNDRRSRTSQDDTKSRDGKSRHSDTRHSDSRNSGNHYDDYRYIDGGRYEKVRFDDRYEIKNRDGNGREAIPTRTAEVEKPRKKKSFWAKFFKVLLLAIPVFVIVVTFVSVGASLLASGIACIGSGAAQTFVGFAALPVSKAVALSKVGMGAVTISVGVFLTAFSVWFIKITCKIFRAIFGRKRRSVKNESEVR